MIPDNITRDDILEAIKEVNDSEIPEGREATKYYLRYNGKHYPPKYVISVSNKIVSGEELPADIFSGGKEVNDFLKDRGFSIIDKNSVEILDELLLNEELYSRIIERYIDHCKRNNWLQNEAYKFRFGNWMKERLDLKNMNENDVYQLCIESQEQKYEMTGGQKGINFITSRKRFHSTFLEMDDIKVLLNLPDLDKLDETDISESKLSLPKLSVWAGIFYPGKYFILANEELIESLFYIFNLDDKNPPRSGFNAFLLSQVMMRKCLDHIGKYDEELKSLLQKQFVDKSEYSNLDRSWFIQDINLFLNNVILGKSEIEILKDFKKWLMSKYTPKSGRKLSPRSAHTYASCVKSISRDINFDSEFDTTDLFSIQNPDVLTEIKERYFKIDKYLEKDQSGRRSHSNSFERFIEFRESKELINDPEPDYWILSPGENAKYYTHFIENEIIGIGWDELGDLREYEDQNDIMKALEEIYGEENAINNSLCNLQFCNDMNIGDHVFLKKGRSEIIAYGTVTSDYIFNGEREHNKSIRKVEWKKEGHWDARDKLGLLAMKTLTQIDREEVIDFLNGIINENGKESDIRYWWLNANPKEWNISEYEEGMNQTYSTHNEKGNKRQKYKYFKEVKKGDKVIGYTTSPKKKITTLCEISDPLFIDEDENEMIEIIIKRQLVTPISWDEIVTIPDLSDSEIVASHQGSLFKVEKDEYDILLKIINDRNPVDTFKPYLKEDALKDLFLSEKDLEKITELIARNKNVILQGPPGVGKTYVAKKLAYVVMEEEDNQRVEMIQFHQSYSYEDFIQGYRPDENSTNFILKKAHPNKLVMKK